MTFTEESLELAEGLVQIESADYHTWNEWFAQDKREWYLKCEVNVHVTAEKSKDGMCWYLWKTYLDQARAFVKIVPRNMSEKTYRTLIQGQPWVCI